MYSVMADQGFLTNQMHCQEDAENGADHGDQCLERRGSCQYEDQASGDEGADRAQQTDCEVLAQRGQPSCSALEKPHCF